MVKFLFLRKLRIKIRIIEAQIVQKLKNNEPRPKFTGSYKKSVCISYPKLYEPDCLELY